MKKYFVLAALMVGILLFALNAVAQSQPEPKPAKPDLKGLAALKEYLQLTPEQEAKLKEFRSARTEDQKAFREQVKKLRQELGGLLRDPQADQKKTDGLIDQLAKLRADHFKVILQNRKEWEKIFTPEQLEKLKNIREKMIGQRGRRMGQGRFFGPGAFRKSGMFGPRPWGRQRGRGMRHLRMWWY